MQKSRSEWESGVGVGALKLPLRVNLLHGFASERTYGNGTIHIMNHKIHQPKRARHGSMSPIPCLMTHKDVETTNYRAAEQHAFNNGLFLCILILHLSRIILSSLHLCVRGHTSAQHQVAILERGEGMDWILIACSLEMRHFGNTHTHAHTHVAQQQGLMPPCNLTVISKTVKRESAE